MVIAQLNKTKTKELIATFSHLYSCSINGSRCVNTSMVDMPYLEARQISDTVIGVFSILLIPMVLFGNISVIISLKKFRKLRSTTNIFIGSLSVADFIIGAVTLPTYVCFYFQRDVLENSKYLCLFKYSTVTCSSSASLLSLVAIAADRYVAITYPLQYHTIMTHRKAKIIIVTIWIYELGIAALPFFWNYYDIYSECSYFNTLPRPYTIFASFFSLAAALVVSFVLYLRIFVIAKQHRQRMMAQKFKYNLKSNKQMEKETKSAKIMALVNIMFYIFWLPFLLVGPIKYLGVAENLVEILKNSALWIAMSNSMMNPILYCWLRVEFTTAFKQLFWQNCRTTARNENQHFSNHYHLKMLSESSSTSIQESV